MGAKQYFWNKKHHKELDREMGLSRRMAEPFASLADACDMDASIGGTRGMSPIFIVSTKYSDIKQTKPYDVTSNEATRTFLMATVLKRPN